MSQLNLAKNWCLVWNNYPDNWNEILEPVLMAHAVGYTIGKEVGKCGTKHLQGYVQFEKKKRPFPGLGLPKQIHWEPAKGSREQNDTYCTKDGDFIRWGSTIPPQKYVISLDLFDWQRHISKVLTEEPNDRDIYWLWEEKGAAGKTTFQKWIYQHYWGVIIVSGKAADMKNGILKWMEKHENKTPRIILINIPRSTDVEHVSWQGIEEVKDMWFFSPKYEGDRKSVV